MRTNQPGLRKRVIAAVSGLVVLVLSSSVLAGGNYLIVTAPAYEGSAPLNAFVSHKTALGFNVTTYVVPTGTSNTTLRAYIRSLWLTPHAPAYVLLIGDTDGPTSGADTVPHFTGGGSKSAPTDWPYGCMDPGDDWQPEIPVGRFSVRTVGQLQAVVEKTIVVETGQFLDPEYVLRAAFLAPSDSSAEAEATHDWVIDNYLTPAGYQPIRIYTAQGGTTADVATAINNGCLWVNYFGHSSSSGWWEPSFVQSDVNALMNDGLYGLVFGFSCSSASYPAAECFGETWIRASLKGSAAYISASTFIYYGGSAWESSRRMEKYFWESFFEDNIWEIGPAWMAGLNRLLNDPYFDISVKRNMFEMFPILGDPSLRLPTFIVGEDPILRLRAPDGGEVWGIGEQHDIRWRAYDDVGVIGVDLFLSLDEGVTYPITIATDLLNTEVYSWTVGSYYSNKCRIKVVGRDADGHAGFDASDANFTITPFGPQVIYNFPMSTNPGWTAQTLWAFGSPTGGGGAHGCHDPTSGHTGWNVYGYNLAGDYQNSLPEKYLTTTALNLTGTTGTKLTFWRWLGVESPSYDHARVQVSANGTSWTTVWENTTEVSDGAWQYQEIDISSVADNQPTVYIRWVMGTTDSMWEFCGWNIDDVQIIGTPTPLRGDMNCDGARESDDVAPFALALTDPGAYAGQYPECTEFQADVNADGRCDGEDIQELVRLLLEP
jgi:hypothetical protein